MFKQKLPTLAKGFIKLADYLSKDLELMIKVTVEKSRNNTEICQKLLRLTLLRKIKSII